MACSSSATIRASATSASRAIPSARRPCPTPSPRTGWAHSGAAASGTACQRPHAIGSSPPNGSRLSDSRPKAIPGAHTSTIGQTSRQRATTIATGAAPILAVGRLAQQAVGGRAPANPPICVVTGNVPHGDRRNQVRVVATGVGRRVQISRQVFGGRGKRAKRRRMKGRHRPDAANHGGCAVSLDRDDIPEGASRRRARRSLAADSAISGLTPSTWPRPPGPVAKDGFPIEDDSLFAPASGAGGSGGRRDPGKFTPESNQGMSHRGPAAQPSGYRGRQRVFALWTRCPNSVRSTEKIFAERVRRSVRIV